MEDKFWDYPIDECGVFGMFNCCDNNVAENIFYGLHSLQHRGQEACGILCVDEDKKYHLFKSEGLVHNVFTDDKLSKLKGKTGIGHVRYSTFGGNSYDNIQPFRFYYQDKNFGLCHNGNIVNSKELKNMLEQRGTIFQATSDSEIIAHLINKSIFNDPMEAIKECLNYVIGAFVFLIMVEDKIYCVRDRNGIRPLSIGKLNDSYVVASETCALEVVGATFIRDLLPGEIIEISSKGIRSDFYATETQMSLCSMEYIYFSRPDSDVEGINVHKAREKSGKILGKKYPADADIVIGVPDSSISAALGYSKVTKIPYEMGLIKNKYIGRTFIEPSKALRERAVALKLTAIKKVVQGKNIALIDDSIVRGTTLKKIVKLLKEAGANKIHIRISSPPIISPCFYGVDAGTFEELIMARSTVEELCKYLGAESLEFLEICDIQECTSKDNLCFSCFSGNYITPIFGKLEEANK